MKRKNDRNAEIVKPSQAPDYAPVHDTIISIGCLFEMMQPLTSDDVGHLCGKAFSPAGRLLVLSQMLFPQVCSIIERGLTLEEICLLSSLDRARVKRGLGKIMTEGLPTIEAKKADGKKFVKVTVPLRINILIDEKEETSIAKESILAPKASVRKLVRKGYSSKDGRSLRYDYLSFVPGPMPVVYAFKSGKDLVRESVDDEHLKRIEERFIKDEGAMGADLEITIAQLSLMKSILESDHALSFMKWMDELCLSIHEGVHHFACRYIALNEPEIYDRMNEMADAFISFSQYLMDKGLTSEPGSCKEMGDHLSEIVERLRAELDE